MAITADELNWKLSEIRDKVRKLTGRPSTNQISDDSVDKYINRFYTQDLPAIIDLKDFESYLRIQTNENIESYPIGYGSYTLNGPGYVNGVEFEVFTDPTCFYDQYPQLFQTRESIGTGDGSTTTFTGTLSKTPVSYRRLVIDDDTETFRIFEDDALLDVSTDLEITGITAASPAVVTTSLAHGLTTGDQVQIQGVNGMREINGFISTVTVVTTTTFQLDNVDSSNFTAYANGGEIVRTSISNLTGDKGGSGTVTSSSGSFSVTFNTAPSNGQDIRANYEFFNTGIPVAGLYYERQLFLSPVPDGVYHVEIPIVGRPAPLLDDNDALAFDDWGKLVAYGASVDLLGDQGQQEEANILSQQFNQLKNQARYRDIKNRPDERSVPRF